MDKYFEEINPKSKVKKPDLPEDEIVNSDGEIDSEKLRLLKKRKIAPLEEIDHSKKTYESVKTVFFYVSV